MRTIKRNKKISSVPEVVILITLIIIKAKVCLCSGVMEAKLSYIKWGNNGF